MKVYIDKCERWPDYFVTTDEEYASYDVSVLVDEETLARWEHAARLYDQAQDEMRDLFNAAKDGDA